MSPIEAFVCVLALCVIILAICSCADTYESFTQCAPDVDMLRAASANLASPQQLSLAHLHEQTILGNILAEPAWVGDPKPFNWVFQ